MRWSLLLSLLPLAVAFPFQFASDTQDGFKLASEHLKSALNLSADPCTDFYNFACGKWIENNPIPNDLTSFGHFQKLREKVTLEMKNLYESKASSSSKSIRIVKSIFKQCMDEEEINKNGAKNLLRHLEAFGYFPMIHNEKWSLRYFDLTELLMHVGISKGMDVFIEYYPGTDIKNVTRRLLQFDQGSLGLGHGTREYYVNSSQYQKQINAYKALLIDRVRLLTEDAGLAVNETKIALDVDEVVEFEKKYAEITVKDDERRNFTALYNPVKLSQIKEFMPLIDWDKLMRAVLPFSIHSYLESDPIVIVSEVDYFRRVSEMLKETDPRVITNYILIRYMAHWGMELGTKYEDVQQKFAKEMYGRKEKAPRWKDCVSLANGRLQYASGAMYIRDQFTEAAKQTTLSMIEDLQYSFKNMLIENEWMDNRTKEVAQEKANYIKNLIAYPDFIQDDEKLDNWYHGLDIDDIDSFSDATAKYVKYSMNFTYSRLLQPVDRDEFSANPATVNAFYSSIKNAIIFPAAILQLPFFHKDYPKALNYGGIGSVIGHEITHGFDDQGRQFDNIGNLVDWWDEKTTEAFTERAKCIIDQYGSIEVPGTDHKINGILTQGENIADNGGVKEAYKAYKRFVEKHGAEPTIPGFEEYDNDQMFYIGYAQSWCGHMTPQSALRQLLTDPHSPGKYRVNVVLSNQAEFASAFKCPANSPMNPPSRCSVW